MVELVQSTRSRVAENTYLRMLLIRSANSPSCPGQTAENSSYVPLPISIASAPASRSSASPVTSASRYSIAHRGGSPTTPSAETRVDSMIFRIAASMVAFGHEDRAAGEKESR
jgi:hypothetical protein